MFVLSGQAADAYIHNISILFVPDDSIPKFPVSKTQPETKADLEKKNPIDLKTPSNIKTETEYDTERDAYILRTRVGDAEMLTPIKMTREEYFDYNLKRSMNAYFRNKAIEEFENKDQKGDYQLKDIGLSLKPIDRLFGPGGIKFTPSGYIQASMGVKNTKTDNPTLSERNRSKTTFDFDQDIQVNVTASVGEKVNFDLNYNTNAMFDFDSRKIKLGYEGDEDEIIKRIEAGNVSMTTTNSLINGGTSLFGINTELQFGKLRVNSIISQQEAEARSFNTKGGSQVVNFEFKADQYDENKHFFLAHYFRDNYDNAMSKIPYVQSPVTITRMEVWITNKSTNYNQARNIVAFADLAENKVISNTGAWSPKGSLAIPHNDANNLYPTVTTTYAQARDISQVTGTFSGIIDGGQDYEKVESARLLNTSEYTFSPQLGYISLNGALQADEVLAVSFEYKMNGKTYQVGEFSSDIVDKYDPANPKSGALFLKLLKPVSLSPLAYTWDLMMKNVYDIGGYSIQKENFNLQITYQSDTVGTYLSYITEGDIKNEMLLRVMNLDRLDSRDNQRPDGTFDFLEGYTIRSSNGKVYFPVVEPFGSHLKKKINDPAIAEKYVYQQLYDSTLTVAQQIAEKNKFNISGSYKGAASEKNTIQLDGLNISEGSVKLTANGVTLTEGVDYIVDSGVATIINQSLIDSNASIQVSMEDRSMSLQRKTLLGMNMSYDFSKNFTLGTTVMHYYEKPLLTKPEIGTEAVKNTLWGFNFAYRTQSQWLTDMIDALPFVDASQASQINLSGEFAKMIAGHYQNEYTGGYSYLDDFENSQSSIDIKNPYAWTLASTPSSFDESKLSNNIDYGKNRAMLSWFMIDRLFTRKNSSTTPSHIKNDEDQLSNHFVREVYLWELYPNRDIAHNESGTMSVLNLSYYPNERGPYNLDATNINTDGDLLNPEKRWGGITRKMDVRDFEATNVEYIEFWLMDPFVYNDKETVANTGGELYFNLGEISEDVLKDGKKFYENGLPINDDPDAIEYTVWGKVPKRQSTVYAFDDSQGTQSRQKQDVGLNGLSTQEELESPNVDTYRKYLDELTSKLSSTALSEQQQDPFSPFNDPAKDTYRYYRGNYYDQIKAPILDRYKFFNGTEGNSVATENSSESYSSAARTTPDVEDIDQDNTMNENESYYEYAVKLRPENMVVGENYIVDSRKVIVPLRNGKEEDNEVTWYQFKIPVHQYDKKVGRISNFKSIRFMRMYLSGFKQTTFLRFGTLQLVRGDWRTYQQTLNVNESPSGQGNISMTTVNIEENSERKPVSYVLPPGTNRIIDPDQMQMVQENEQSLAIKVNNLDPQDARAVYKNVSYDLRRYKRMQLYTHAESLINEPQVANKELSVFMRIGTDYKNNYYEYEIPLTITPAGTYNTNNPSDRNIVWPNDNMFDFSLELLKNLKLKRNEEKRKLNSTVSYTQAYSAYDPERPNNKISVIGNPTLGEVNVIMIGVRNNSRETRSTEIWINELRLTDFDENGGWAAQANAHVALSDVGSITFAGRKETAGFGAIDQSLLERRSDDFESYNVSVSVDAGRFVPKEAKLSIPVYYSQSKQTITPEYDPFDTDIKLDESLGIVQTKAEKDSIKSIAQEKVSTQSISLSNVKLNIKSKNPMPYDPANFTFGYAFNKSETNNPTTVYDVNKDYRATMNYSYSPALPTWQPFSETKNNKGSAKFAKSIGINFLPNNIGFNSNMYRQYSESMMRDLNSYSAGGANTTNQFLSWNQSFFWDRDFNINWDITNNLKTSFQSGTKAEIQEPYLQVNKKLNRDDYEIWKDSVQRSIRNLGDPYSYRQAATITYQIPFKNIPAMDWVRASSLNYTSGYQWDRGAQVDSLDLGNTISNTLAFETRNSFDLRNLYNKFGYLKKINDRFDQRGQNSTTRQRRAQEAQRAKRKRFTQEVTLASDSSTVLAHGLGTKNIEISAKSDGRTYNVKYKKLDENSILITNKDSAVVQLSIQEKIAGENNIWQDMAEYSIRGLMSIRSIDFNYSKRQDTYIAGFRPGIGDVFGQGNSAYGMVPGLGFAFGLDGGVDYVNSALDRNWLIMDTLNVSPAIYNNTETFEFRTQIEPIKNLTIDLNANREVNKRYEIQYMYDGSPVSRGGSFSMTTISLSSALKSSKADNNYYSQAFQKFLDNRAIIKNRLEQKYQNTVYPNNGFMSENAHLVGQPYSSSVNGVDQNSPDVLIPAFLAAYTGKDANSNKLSPFPTLLAILPNWNISYDGLTTIDALKKHFKVIRLSHRYSSLYRVNGYDSYSNWVDAGDDLGFIRNVLNGSPVPSSPYNISAVSIDELFNPLFGVETTFNNNMTVEIKYIKGRDLTLNMASYQVIEVLRNEWDIRFGYRINEFNRILGLTSRSAKKFNNDLNLKANFSYTQRPTLIRKIEENYTQATAGTTIVTLGLSADYAISEYMTFAAFLDQVMNQPLITSSGYPTTNTNFGISIKFILLQ